MHLRYIAVDSRIRFGYLFYHNLTFLFVHISSTGPQTTLLNMASSSSTPRAITITYTLHPPTSVDAQTVKHNDQLVPTNIEKTYSITPSTSSTSTSSATSQHYAALGPALRTATKELMEGLTAWKDAVGDLEKGKEDPGTPGFGRGKAAMMSEGVMDVDESDSEDEDGVDDQT
jgi:hypothetical protein